MEKIADIQFKDEIERAITFALAAHSEQKRKESINYIFLPYIFHPMDVAKKIWDWGAVSIFCLQAAILHDVVEDTEYDVNTIRQFFGSEVANLVEELTFYENSSWSQYEKSDKKKEYMNSFRTKTIDALVIKLADRLCNVHDFCRSSNLYAPKYLAKAEPLISFMLNRKQEINERFGNGVFEKMLDNYKQIVTLLQGWQNV